MGREGCSVNGIALLEAFDRVLFGPFLEPLALLHPGDYAAYVEVLPAHRVASGRKEARVTAPFGLRGRTTIRVTLHAPRGVAFTGPLVGKKEPREAYAPAPTPMTEAEFYRRALTYLEGSGSKGHIYLHPEDAKIFVAFSSRHFASELGVGGYDGRIGEVSGRWGAPRALYALPWVSRGTVLVGSGGGSAMAEVYSRTTTLWT
jgi:hypothetical protein